MKVMVTGAAGQLGTALLDAFVDADVVGLTRDDLDITDEVAATTCIDAIKPDVVINAAAMTDVDRCEREPELADAVNARGPELLAAACNRMGASLVAVSTDYVFGADPSHDGVPYAEDAPIAPCNVYGASKADGEARVRNVLAAHQIVRTSWVYGADQSNFVQAIAARARRGEDLRVVDDQFGCPTWSVDLAAAIREIALSATYGTFHRANSGHCSRFDFAQRIVGCVGSDVAVEPTDSARFASSDDVTRAQRPRWSVLIDHQTRAAGFSAMRSWEDAFDAACEAGVVARATNPSRGVADADGDT